MLGTLSVDRVLSALQLEERPPLDLNDPRYWLHGKRAPSLSASPPQASPPPNRSPSLPIAPHLARPPARLRAQEYWSCSSTRALQRTENRSPPLQKTRDANTSLWTKLRGLTS